MNEHEADGRRFTHFSASPPLNSAMHALQRREKEREREGAGLHLTSTTEFVLGELNLSERATSGKVGGNGSPINTLTSPRLSDRLIVHACSQLPVRGVQSPWVLWGMITCACEILPHIQPS